MHCGNTWNFILDTHKPEEADTPEKIPLVELLLVAQTEVEIFGCIFWTIS